MDFTREEIEAELRRRGLGQVSHSYEPSTRTEGHLNSQGKLPGSEEGTGTEAERVGGEDKFARPADEPGFLTRLANNAGAMQDRLLDSASFGAYGAAQRLARQYGLQVGATPESQQHFEAAHPYLASTADAVGMLPKATPAGAVAEMTGRTTDALLARVVAKRALENKIAQRVALPAARGAAATAVNAMASGRPVTAGDVATGGVTGPLAEALPKAAQAGAAAIEKAHPIVARLREHGLEPGGPLGPAVRPIQIASPGGPVPFPGAPEMPRKATAATRSEAARAGGDAALAHEGAIKDANEAAYGERERAALAREGDNWVNVRPLVERIDAHLGQAGTDDATAHALHNLRNRLLNPSMSIENGGQPYMRVRDLWDLKGYLRAPSKLGAPGMPVQPNKAPFADINSHLLRAFDQEPPPAIAAPSRPALPIGPQPKVDRLAHVPDLPISEPSGRRTEPASGTEAAGPRAIARRDGTAVTKAATPQHQLDATQWDGQPTPRQLDETAIQHRGAAPDLAALDREYFDVNQDQRQRLGLLGTTQKAGVPQKVKGVRTPSELTGRQVAERVSQEGETGKAGGKGVVGGQGHVRRYEGRVAEPRMLSGTDVPLAEGLNEALERPQLHILQDRLQFSPGHFFGTAKDASRGRFSALLDEPGAVRLARPALLGVGRVDTGRVPMAVDTLTQAIQMRRQRAEEKRRQEDQESQP